MAEIKHIAFIMDGNGRWAKKRLLPRNIGHREGVKAMERVIEACVKRGIKVISFYAFSTENWGRPQDEIDKLFEMVNRFAVKQMVDYVDKGYQVRFMGDISQLPIETYQSVSKIIDMSQNNNDTVVNIGLNYGSRDEIIRACTKLSDENKPFTMENISTMLDTAGLPDPDVIVRSAGEKRLSNFMLWQAAYSELIFKNEFWPEFDDSVIEQIIEEYNQRDRRYGKI